MASLNNPYDFNFYIQNFTYKTLGVVVKGGEEITLEYQFQVHPMLEPVDFTFASVVFYESDELMYSNTFFNQVIVNIVEHFDYERAHDCLICRPLSFTCQLVIGI